MTRLRHKHPRAPFIASGFVNDTCKTDADCYDPNSMQCTSKRCQCIKNYIEDPSLPPGAKKRTCVSSKQNPDSFQNPFLMILAFLVPSLFSPCTDTCQKPYECKTGSAIEGAMMPPMPGGGSGKTCQCPGKSRYVNGYCDAGMHAWC